MLFKSSWQVLKKKKIKLHEVEIFVTADAIRKVRKTLSQNNFDTLWVHV
jgi:hypothetical protein